MTTISETRTAGRRITTHVTDTPPIHHRGNVITPQKVHVLMGRRLHEFRLLAWRPVQITAEGPGTDGWAQVRWSGLEHKPAWLQHVVDQLVATWEADR